MGSEVLNSETLYGNKVAAGSAGSAPATPPQTRTQLGIATSFEGLRICLSW